MTQHHTAARKVVASPSCFAYHTMLRALPNRGLVGSQGLKRTIKNKPNINACAEIHFPMKIPDLSNHLYRPEKNSLFFKFKFQSLNLRASFARLFNFKLLKTYWKGSKLNRRILADFEKMSLARWFWAFYAKSVLVAKTNEFSCFYLLR